MEISKYRCSNCHKAYYVEGINVEPPVCHCSWFNEMKLVWIDCKPTKRLWDEIRESGTKLRRKPVTKKDAFRFTAALYTKDGETEEELLEKLPF